jgi:hypothetical protein
MKRTNTIESGKPAYESIAFPGGYAIRYYFNDGEVLCANCVNESFRNDGDEFVEPEGAMILWEGPTTFCAECNEEMASEYGDPDDESLKDVEVDDGNA